MSLRFPLIAIAILMFPSMGFSGLVRIANPVGGHIHPSACVSQKGTIVVIYGHINHRDLRITRSTDGGKPGQSPSLLALR